MKIARLGHPVNLYFFNDLRGRFLGRWRKPRTNLCREKLSQPVNSACKSYIIIEGRHRLELEVSHNVNPRNLPSMFCSSPILGKRIHLAPHIRETRQFRSVRGF